MELEYRYTCTVACLLTKEMIIVDYDQYENLPDLLDIMGDSLLLGDYEKYNLEVGVYRCDLVFLDNGTEVSEDDEEDVPVELLVENVTKLD